MLKNAHTLLMIDHLWSKLCSYFGNALGFDTLLIQLNDTWSFSWFFAIFFCGIEEIGNSYIFPEIYIYSLLHVCFPLKWHANEFFSGGHAWRSWVTLTLYSFFWKMDISEGAGGLMSYLWKSQRGGGSSILWKNEKIQGGGGEGGSLVKFPPWWGYGYFLELLIDVNAFFNNL